MAITRIKSSNIEDGTIADADIAGSISSAKITSLDATKLTGDVDIARLPTAVLNSNVPATDTSVLEYNMAILAFKVAAADSLSKFQMVDQVIDDYKDTTGIDTANSIADNIFEGHYSGVIRSTNYFGDDSGAAQIFVVSNGEFTGLIDGLYELRGNVSENGSLSGSYSESDYSLEWDGILETDGTGSGSWSSNLSGTGYSGDWEAVKD